MKRCNMHERLNQEDQPQTLKKLTLHPTSSQAFTRSRAMSTFPPWAA